MVDYEKNLKNINNNLKFSNIEFTHYEQTFIKTRESHFLSIMSQNNVLITNVYNKS